MLFVSFRFFNNIFSNAKYSPECNIIAYIYILRVTTAANSGVSLTMKNWRGLWISAIIIAQKVRLSILLLAYRSQIILL